MPQSENIIATKTISGNVDLFDINKHPDAPLTDEVKPELRLIGHTREGFGLSWNSKMTGYLLSGSDDQNICVWDINKTN